MVVPFLFRVTLANMNILKTPYGFLLMMTDILTKPHNSQVSVETFSRKFKWVIFMTKSLFLTILS